MTKIASFVPIAQAANRLMAGKASEMRASAYDAGELRKAEVLTQMSTGRTAVYTAAAGFDLIRAEGGSVDYRA